MFNYKTIHEKKILTYIAEQSRLSFLFPSLLENFLINERLFLLLEFIPYKTLSDYFFKYPWSRLRIFPSAIAKIETQLGKILQELSELNLIHRDITPDNIMIDPKTKKIILIDFGYAIYQSEEIEVRTEEEKELLDFAVENNLGGRHRKPGNNFSHDSDRYSSNLIIEELKQMSPWV